MRRLPNIIEKEFGKDTLKLYRKLERTVLKISDYKNHRRFLPRCLSKGVIPAVLSLRTILEPVKVIVSLYQTEKKLRNERIRNINNSIECLDHEKYMYENNLNTIVHPGMIKECEDYTDAAKTVRHLKVLQQQVSKFERLIEKNSAKRSSH